jgi:hypothetical protein
MRQLVASRRVATFGKTAGFILDQNNVPLWDVVT